MSEIIFICTGNTCRSPMAAALAAEMLAEAGINIAIGSAGVMAAMGLPASTNAQLALANPDKPDSIHPEYHISNHKSRPISHEMLTSAKLVLTMTSTHLIHVSKLAPDANAYTLGEYAGNNISISDPFGGSLEEYIACAAQIKELLEACMPKLTSYLS